MIQSFYTENKAKSMAYGNSKITRRVWSEIIGCVREHGYYPSIKQLVLLGPFSSSSQVSLALDNLERQDLIERYTPIGNKVRRYKVKGAKIVLPDIPEISSI